MSGNDTMVMPRNKKTAAGQTPRGDSEKYRKAYKMVRIRARLAAAGEAAAKQQLEQDLTQYINDALRMRLEAEGHWPPKSS